MLSRKKFISAVAASALMLSACTRTESRSSQTHVLESTYTQFFEQVMARIARNKINATRSSRIYGTLSLGLLITAAPQDGASQQFLAHVSDVPTVSVPNGDYNVSIASIAAASSIARQIFPTDIDKSSIAEIRDRLVHSLSLHVSPEVVSTSLAFGQAVSAAVMTRSAGDGFERATEDTLGANVPSIGRWVSTPPSFQPASDPGWGTLRPFIVGTSECSLPAPHAGTDVNSPYENDAQEVLAVSLSLSDSEKSIARFWDDGRGRSGTPTGHWLRIALEMATRSNMSDIDTIRTIAAVAIGNADTMIQTWKAKYTYRVERPVTVIQRKNPTWNSYLVTPAFPEYPSGHSTLSRTSADVLTHIFGDMSFSDPGFGMTQQSREQFKISPRSFSSFRAAANEASKSRMYAGIHYTQGLEAGKTLGACVAHKVIAVLGAH